jgi:glutamate--cysteine ligase
MSFSIRFDRLVGAGMVPLLRGGLKGLEKESLRLNADGRVAETDHPSSLGSALTHPQITTDYSEALIELITPAFDDAERAIEALSDIHRFVLGQIGDEILLATSMPVGIDGDDSIPIARYGTSNIGKMKHVYRQGLSWRYGRTMQAIAGLHYNYSFPEALWPALLALESPEKSLQEGINDAYFGVVRNVHRYGWLLIYLFGNSPALDAQFFKGREFLANRFESLDPQTYCWPNATSLRMSDIGYKNDTQMGLNISFDNLDQYVESLESAINCQHPPYTAIGIKVNGQYRQLNDNILQIENEYYSPVRPKQIAQSGEKPTMALRKRGVRYLELRAMDLQCHESGGISLEALRFLEIFTLWCLIKDSPPLSNEAKTAASRNHLAVACCGRGSDFILIRDEEEVPLRPYANEILSEMLEIATVIDDLDGRRDFRAAIEAQLPRVADVALTPSARILKTLRDEKISFREFALDLSRRHAIHWRSNALSSAQEDAFRKIAETSWQRQREIEASDRMDFETYLDAYWRQA